MKNLAILLCLATVLGGCTKEDKKQSSDGNFCSQEVINNSNDIVVWSSTSVKSCIRLRELLQGGTCQAVSSITKQPMTIPNAAVKKCPPGTFTPDDTVGATPRGPIPVPGTQEGRKDSDLGQGVDRFGHCTPRLLRMNERLQKAIDEENDGREHSSSLKMVCYEYKRLLNGKNCRTVDAQTKEVLTLKHKIEACE